MHKVTIVHPNIAGVEFVLMRMWRGMWMLYCNHGGSNFEQNLCWQVLDGIY